MLLKARASTREGSVSDTLAPSVPHKATAKHHPSASHSRPPSSPLARSSAPLRGPLSALFSSPAVFPVHIPAPPLTRGPRLHPPPRRSLKSSRLAAFGYFCLAFVANYRSPNPCGFYMFRGVGGTRGGYWIPVSPTSSLSQLHEPRPLVPLRPTMCPAVPQTISVSPRCQVWATTPPPCSPHPSPAARMDESTYPEARPAGMSGCAPTRTCRGSSRQRRRTR